MCCDFENFYFFLFLVWFRVSKLVDSSIHMQSSSFPPSILTRWLAEFLLTELNVFIQGFSQYGPAYQTNQTLG